MCNPVAVGIGLTLLGSAASYAGQREAARKQRRLVDQELGRQRRDRQKSLRASAEVVQQHDPKKLAADIEAGKEPVARTNAQAEQLAETFAPVMPGTAGADGGAYTEAARGGARDASRSLAADADRRAFANALGARSDALRRLGWTHDMIGMDTQRRASRLPYALQRAGNAGAGLRLGGGLASGIGGGMANSYLWGTPYEMSAEQQVRDFNTTG